MPTSRSTPNELLLGPVLRRVEGGSATVWFETAGPGTVEVRAGDAVGVARTFGAYGHHYCLVVVDGLAPGSVTPYRVLLDGVPVWPRRGDPFPPPVIRTRPAAEPTAGPAEQPAAEPTAEPADQPAAEPVRLVFGSCRKSTSAGRGSAPDALDTYATRLAAAAPDRAGGWPDTLVLLGDQVYADEPPGTIRAWLRARRGRRPAHAPDDQVADFHEYTRLYLESWGDPELRWLLSTVPSLMIFDDHEIIDDWNSSESWRRDTANQRWWPRRIRAGLASYWIYQHLGNLAPTALATDPVYSAVVTAGDDATEVLDAFGARADAERGWYRWSYALDLGRTRLVVLDNRCSRALEPGKRAMLPGDEWDWFAGAARGDHDHLVIGSSLPWLMPPALHHVEAVDELLCESRHRPVAAVAEWLRRWLDLEHWPAFNRSFEALTALLAEIGSAPAAPATISVLSGDVHHSYAARADLGPDVRSAVHQLTCSPINNDVPAVLRPAMRAGWHTGTARRAEALARRLGQPPPAVRWRRLGGPYFDNAIGILTLTGRTGHVTVEAATPTGALVPIIDLGLDR